jgi:hypothetical protein
MCEGLVEGAATKRKLFSCGRFCPPFVSAPSPDKLRHKRPKTRLRRVDSGAARLVAAQKSLQKNENSSRRI